MATRLNGKISDDGLVFHFDTGDFYNSYKGEPTTNMNGTGGPNIYSWWTRNIQTITTLSETYQGQPIYRVALSLDIPDQVSYINSRWGAGSGWYLGGQTYNANTPYMVSTIWRPVSHSDIQIYGHPSNIGGWGLNVDGNVDYYGGWRLHRIDRNFSSTVSDARYFHIHAPTAVIGDVVSVDITHMQQEAKSRRTFFTTGTRTSTQGLLDLKNNVTLDLSGVSFSSDTTSKIIYDGTDDKIHNTWPSSLNVDDNTTPRTWEIVVRKTGGASDTGIFGHKAGPGCSYYCNGGIYQANGRWYFNWYDNSAYRWLDSGINATTNEYFHVVGVFDTDANPRIYVNGVLRASYGSSTQLDYSSGMAYYDFGFNSDGGGLYYFTGEIPVAKFYKNRALTDVEVYENFLHYQQRFNMTFTQNGIGGNSSSSYITSLDILKKTRTNTNGNYWFKPLGVSTPFQAYVEFETNGGNPWMHVGTIADEDEPSNNSTYHVWSNNMNSAQTCPPWDDESTFGGSTPTFTSDYKNAGWSNIPFKQILIKDAGDSQRKILHTNEGEIKSSNSSLRTWFESLKWGAVGSDSSNSAYSANRVKSVAITNYGISDPVLQSSGKSRLLFKYGEIDGAQDGNKDRTMIAWHRHDAGDGVDGPTGLGCFTNRGGSIDYRDIVQGSSFPANQDFPPANIGGTYYYSIWIR